MKTFEEVLKEIESIPDKAFFFDFSNEIRMMIDRPNTENYDNFDPAYEACPLAVLVVKKYGYEFCYNSGITGKIANINPGVVPRIMQAADNVNVTSKFTEDRKALVAACGLVETEHKAWVVV